MNLKSVILGVFVISAINQISATFLIGSGSGGCLGDGKDVCNCRQAGVTAPRPYPIQIPRLTNQPLIKTICKEHTVQGPKPFDPIGDICKCGQQIVKPAPLPRQPCRQQNQPKWNFNLNKPCNCAACTANNQNYQSQESNNCGCGELLRAPEEYQVHSEKGATIYFETSKSKATAPPKPRYGHADAVSIAIAQRLADSAKKSVSEKQLQYGSLKEPTANQKTAKKPLIQNEESFYGTNGAILEIKSNMFHRKPESSESESSEEVKQPKKTSERFNPANLKFEDIGYGSYEPSTKPRYVVVKNSEPVKHECSCKQRSNSNGSRRRNERPCDCYKDLVVEASSISEQSLSNESDGYRLSRSYFST